MIRIPATVLALLLPLPLTLYADHEVLMAGNGRLAKVNAAGEVTWEMKWGGIHDIHVLGNGHIMVQEQNRKVVEIDPKTKKVVWQFDRFDLFGNSAPNSILLDLLGQTIR